jgi:hypothetical protein
MTEIIASSLDPSQPTDRQQVPQGYKVTQIEDLNGQFAPQTGNIQPEIANIPKPLQVNFNHPADGTKGSGTAYIDDWVEVHEPQTATATATTKTKDPKAQKEPNPNLPVNPKS